MLQRAQKYHLRFVTTSHTYRAGRLISLSAPYVHADTPV